MHRLIHIELERFGRERLGDDAWEQAALEAGVPGKVYLPTARYEDDELVALVVGVAKTAGTGPQHVLEDFGAAVVPTLLESYGYLRSERRMCGVAKGIIRGVAAHYGEQVEVEEESCM